MAASRAVAVASFTSKENPMTNQIRAYDPLTSENAALVLVDHQVGLMTGLRDYSTGALKSSRTMGDRRPVRFMEPWTWAGPRLLAKSPKPTENDSVADAGVDARALASAYNFSPSALSVQQRTYRLS